MTIVNKECKVCPVGCSLKITIDESNPSSYKVQGNSCGRGADYGIKEI